MNFALLNAAGGMGSSMLPLILIYVAFFAILYFVMIRPQRKQQKETAKMQNEIVGGDWVLLNNGMYGKVVNVINDNLMVEFGVNRGVIVPVRRDQILAKKEPDLTQKIIEDAPESAPSDAVIGEDLAEDKLDAYDQYLLEKGGKKKKGLFSKKD